MAHERFNRALRAMKSIGLSSNTVTPILRRLLKLYDSEWDLIEAESYRVLADAVFESQDEQEKRKEARKQAAKQQVFDASQTEIENEAELENAAPLTRARSVVITHVVSHKRDEIPVVGFEPVTIQEERNQVHGELACVSTSYALRKPKAESVEAVRSGLQQQNDGRGKRIACETPLPLSLPPPPPTVLKKPKLELGNDLAESSIARNFSTPVLEEELLVSLAGPLKRPKIEQDGCAFAESQPMTVLKVLPIASINTLSSLPRIDVQASADLEGLERIQEDCVVRDCPMQYSSALGAIAEAYMEMDKEEDYVSDLSWPGSEAHLTGRNLNMNRQRLGDAQPQLEYNNGLQGLDRAQPYLEYSNDLQGVGHAQPCLEYNNGLQGLHQAQPCLEYRNGLQGLDCTQPCLEYNHLQESGHAQSSMDYSSGSIESSFPQPSLDMVLKMAEDYTLQSFKILAPNFPIMKLMEEFCRHFLQSRERVHDAAQTEVVSTGQNLLMSNDQDKVRRSSRINQKTQEPPRLDKGKVSSETKARACKSKMLISVESCSSSFEESRPVHDLGDISRGEESIRLPVVNEVTSESSPPRFHYIQKSIVYQNAYVNFSLARVGDDDCCSNCFGDCLQSPITCACARETGGEYAYTRDGVLRKDYLEEAISMQRKPQKHQIFYCKDCPLERTKNEDKPDPCKGHVIRKFIKECWSKCGCNKQCGNRLVQRGINRKLQVFFTPEGKGWGVRTLEDIPRGAFVCEYVGEILTNTELYNRNNERIGNEKHTYPVLLDADWCSEGVLKDEEALCLDATHYGNVARFVNHRCFDANLMEFPVEVESPDRHYYHLAFFTTRKVEAQEELTWDYGIDFDDHHHPIKAFQCLCGSNYCREAKQSASRKLVHR